LRVQSALTDVHLAHALIEERTDLRCELLNVDGARGVARHVEVDLFPLFLASIFPSIFAAIFLPVLAAVFTPVFLAYVGLGERPDRQRHRREQSDGRDSGCD